VAGLMTEAEMRVLSQSRSPVAPSIDEVCELSDGRERRKKR
jgi:hypothetical protein